ncbi:MAG: hypothetical protein LUQ17_03630 [Methanomicrobiales archaeon]|nr:hypothetical protein [Methanomicrobiales archaeon]
MADQISSLDLPEVVKERKWPGVVGKEKGDRRSDLRKIVNESLPLPAVYPSKRFVEYEEIRGRPEKGGEEETLQFSPAQGEGIMILSRAQSCPLQDPIRISPIASYFVFKRAGGDLVLRELHEEMEAMDSLLSYRSPVGGEETGEKMRKGGFTAPDRAPDQVHPFGKYSRNAEGETTSLHLYIIENKPHPDLRQEGG